MEIFNKSGIGVASVLLLVGSIIACQSKDEMLPSPAQIEATALTARQGSEASAERRVREWAEQGLPVAQRELGLLYKNRLDRRADAITMFEKAARAGDAEAAFQLGEMYRVTSAGGKAEPAKAWPWYEMAAQHKHAKAALALALLLKSGHGIAPDGAATIK
jgi:TPR repeat protein